MSVKIMNNWHFEDIPTLRSFLKNLNFICFLKYNTMVLLWVGFFVVGFFLFLNMSLNQAIIAIYGLVIIFTI